MSFSIITDRSCQGVFELTDIKLTRRQEKTLARLQQKLGETKSEIEKIGFVLQGSVTERWIKCGKSACWCHKEPVARHGPYYQWSWKSGGRTYSVSLTPEQAVLCDEWVKNNQKLEGITRRLRELSIQAVRLYQIRRN
jgi:hypothetical protein